MTTYSVAEQELIHFFGFDSIAYNKGTQLDPRNLYQIMAIHAFRGGFTGPEVDALRRGLEALIESHPKRLTEEFDNIISFK